MKSPSIVVIGAGVGGIAAAIHLARAGLHVTVLEKNAHPGGRCGRFVREGHHFDSGPTLFVMLHVYEAEMAALGVSLYDILTLHRVDPTYHLHFDDGSELALTSDLKAMGDQLEAIEKGSFANYLRYLAEGQRHYDTGMARLVQRDFRRAGEFFTPRNLGLLFRLKLLMPHYRHMGAFFRHPHLKAAFTFQDIYMGLSPFEAPAIFSMMPYTELAHGVWYPQGGMYSLVQALMQLAEHAGVEFAFEAAVTRIEVQGEVKGVALADGHILPADVVIANADLPYVYDQLLPDETMASKLTHKRFSCSVISFFWGVDQPVKGLGPHTLFLADEYRENFDRITHRLPLPRQPSLYIHAPTQLDPSMAPPGQDTLTAIVPIGHLDDEQAQDWPALRDAARQAVFERLASVGLGDLPRHLKFEVCYTPLSWRKRYNLMKGATHGLCHNLMQLGYFRPHNRHARYENLYFVGASTHPGTGLPTALISARLVAARVLEDLGMRVCA